MDTKLKKLFEEYVKQEWGKDAYSRAKDSDIETFSIGFAKYITSIDCEQINIYV